MRGVLVAAVGSLLAAGCLAAPDAPAPSEASAAESPFAGKPAMVKLGLQTTPTPTTLVEDALGRASVATRTFEVENGTGRLHLALDVYLTTRDQGKPTDEIGVEVKGPDGAPVLSLPPMQGARKVIADLPVAAPGTYTMDTSYRGLWTVGLVVVTFPVGYEPGIEMNVSFPEQTEIDHSFQPARITTGAGNLTRITLLDYDPHQGTANLQHNIHFPKLAIRTEGKTTWGEVRVLDFRAPVEPGEYEFYCEFHASQLKGVLVVA